MGVFVAKEPVEAFMSVISENALDSEAQLWSEELIVCEDKSGESKLGSFTLKASSSASFQSRDGAAYLDFIGQHFDPHAPPLSPYSGIDAIEITPSGGPRVYRPQLPKDPRPLEAEGGKLWTMSPSACSDLENIIGKKLDKLDDPYYISSTLEKNKDTGVALRSMRAGDMFFDTCAKVWNRISRADMQKEWVVNFEADGIAGFNYERSLCEYNNENAGIQYPKEWQNEDILPARESNIMEQSEIQEPITITREEQLHKLERVAKRVCKRSKDADPAAVFAHLALFTHSMRAAQDALDYCCKQPEGTKSRNSAHKDYIVCLEPEDVWARKTADITDQMWDVYHNEKGRVLGTSDPEAEQSEHDWASMRVPKELMEKRCVQASFIEAHNKNVDAMCELLASKTKREFTAYPNCLQNYAARLRSDTLIQAAISLRKTVEDELSSMRKDLYTERDESTVRDRLIARGVKNGWKGIEDLQAELDEYNLEHLEKINDKISKRVNKANENLEYVPSDETVKRWKARAVRKLRLTNENGVPHNLKYGKWHFGKIHSFKGNITGSPVAGSPVVPPRNSVSAEAALQYAFLTSNDQGYKLHNRSTISHTYEGCSVKMDLAGGVVSLSVRKGGDTLEKSMGLPRTLKDTGKKAAVVFRWTSKSNEYLETEIKAAI